MSGYFEGYRALSWVVLWAPRSSYELRASPATLHSEETREVCRLARPVCAAAYLTWLGQPCNEASRQGARPDHDFAPVRNSLLRPCSKSADDLQSVVVVGGVGSIW